MADQDVKYKLAVDSRDALTIMREFYHDLDRVDAKWREFDVSAQSANKSVGKMKEVPGIFSQIGVNLKSIIPDITTMAAGFLEAQAIMSGFSKLIRMVKAEMDDLKRKGQDAANAMLSFEEGSAKAVGLANIGKLEQFQEGVKRIRDETKTTTGVLNAMGIAYKEGMPGATPEEQLDVIKRLAPLETAVGGVEGLARISRTAGTLKRAMPGYKEEDTADLAVVLETAGADIETTGAAVKAIQQLTAAKMKDDEAVALVLTMVKKKYGGREIGTVVGMLTEDIEAPVPVAGKLFTDKQRVQQELAGMTPDERVAWLENEENRAKAQQYFGTAFVKAAPAMTAADIEATRQEIKRVKTTDVTGEFTKQIKGRQGLLLTQLEKTGEASTETEKMDAEKAREGLIREKFEQYMEQGDKGVMGRFWTRRMLWGKGFLAKNLGWMGFNEEQGFYPDYGKNVEEYLSGQRQGWRTEESQAPLLNLRDAIRDLNIHNEQILKAVLEQNALTKEQVKLQQQQLDQAKSPSKAPSTIAVMD